ncbi:MAG TPA: nucleotidyltransferase family protein [Pusillimonas sp.]|jgi:MurNAc alpha-1-phosphate uridylyltransferase|uniref:N-acetylmuramate alpha-1-phosphate uridylyltransferase MurU n=1 Tax=unclassified Pusillimonas TaxID=2640016 RepID=UPI00262CE605|nr:MULTISPECIES: nucleotidyltransferase family protein [unclassified Pusillimonas]HLU19969.1 nucleotidyltransferase family protein [Pusillimonas sp.]
MRAMILAAGRGERMRPLTDTKPKPLLKAGGLSLIEWHIKRLVDAGITQLVINHAWLGPQIEDALGDGRRYGANIAYSREDTALETAGGIARALPLLGKDPFLVVNGDIWCDWDPKNADRAASMILSRDLQAWLLLTSNPAHHPDGDFSLDDEGMLCTTSGPESFTFTGIGVYRPEFFSNVPPGTPAPLAPLLYQGIEMRRLAGEYYNGLWIDVGTPQRLAELNSLLSSGSHL